MEIREISIGNVFKYPISIVECDENDKEAIQSSVDRNTYLKWVYEDLIITKDILSDLLGSQREYDLDKLIPIPINKERMLELGAKQSNKQFYLGNGKIMLSWFTYDENSVFLDIEGQLLEMECKYVHAIQNIYYALTQEELSWK